MVDVRIEDGTLVALAVPSSVTWWQAGDPLAAGMCEQDARP